MAKRPRRDGGLDMGNGVVATSLRELRDHLDMDRVMEYYRNGRLRKWLLAAGYNSQAMRLGELDPADPNLENAVRHVIGAPVPQADAETPPVIENLPPQGAKGRRQRAISRRVVRKKPKSLPNGPMPEGDEGDGWGPATRRLDDGGWHSTDDIDPYDSDGDAAAGELFEDFTRLLAEDPETVRQLIDQLVDSLVEAGVAARAASQEKLDEVVDEGTTTIILAEGTYRIRSSQRGLMLIGDSDAWPRLRFTGKYAPEGVIAAGVLLDWTHYRDRLLTDDGTRLDSRKYIELFKHNPILGTHMLAQEQQVGCQDPYVLSLGAEFLVAVSDQDTALTQAGVGMMRKLSDEGWWFGLLLEAAVSVRNPAMQKVDNLDKVVRWLGRAARTGQAIAMCMYAQCMVEMLDAASREEGYEWMRRSALQGNPTAQSRLGQMLMEGAGCEKNPAEGRRWLELAALRGEREAAKLVRDISRKEDGASSEAYKRWNGLLKAIEAGEDVMPVPESTIQ